jgi:hypothetical protein
VTTAGTTGRAYINTATVASWIVVISLILLLKKVSSASGNKERYTCETTSVLDELSAKKESNGYQRNASIK